MTSPEHFSTAPQEFERTVAHIFRRLGSRVQQNVSLAGNQIDLLVEEKASAGAIYRTAVECKAYSRQVGVDIVNSFATLAQLLRNRRLIDRAAIVALSGFSTSARQSAEHHGVDLISFEELTALLESRPTADSGPEEPEPQGREDAVLPVSSERIDHRNARRIFVIMPFGKLFDDAYVFGIREAAESEGFIVERADDALAQTDDLLVLMRGKIIACDLVVADTTGGSPNVLYELGFADALGQRTLLISQKGGDLPFNISTRRHLFYDTIIDLQAKVKAQLRRIGSELQHPPTVGGRS